MAALHKPYRVAFLVPDVTVEGTDTALEHEAAFLVWIACIEVCQRHPGLSVYDAESTPIAPRDGHFVPVSATRGATPTDAFFGPARRNELVWLELTLIAGKSGAVRLHTIARDGTRQSFDAVGRKVGDQIDQVLGAWLAARGLGPLPKRFEPVTADEILSVVRTIAPTLIERARLALPAPTLPTWTMRVGDAGQDDDSTAEVDIDSFEGDIGLDGDTGKSLEIPELTTETPPVKRLARPLTARLPAHLKLPALRVLVLVLHEPLDDLILAVDPEHPQALFARFISAAGKDFALLRRVIAAAPGWARPYAELVDDDVTGQRVAGAPSHLETVAGAGIAAMCRPGHLDVLDAASKELEDEGRFDEAARLMERAIEQHDEPRAHVALMRLLRNADRVGQQLELSVRAGQRHGCPMESYWYPDQILIDLWVSEALANVGRLDEAIALRANRIEGREATWPRYTRLLAGWRKDPKFVARCYALEGYFRGDESRAVEGFGRIEPANAVELAVFIDSLVALGREAEVPLAWAHFGLGLGFDAPVARLAAARGMMAAGEWRRGMEELWRFELTEPGRDEQVAIARCGLLMSCAPIGVAETALGDRVAIGATTLARRMARDIADFMPAAATSGLVARALASSGRAVEFDPAWLNGFAADTPSRRAIDALFIEHGALRGGDDQLARGDRLVNRWLEVAFTEASEDDLAGLARAAAYVAAQALARYLASTTAAPSAIAGALRTVASEALELVRRQRRYLGDREARAIMIAIEPVLRRVDRWVGGAWLATVERCSAIDERSRGDIAGFVRDQATVSARVLGPEEVAVLAASVARLHRDRPDGWASAVGTQAERLALHTGFAGVDEWADALVVQLAENTIDVDDAIDGLHTACYLAEGKSVVPSIHAARILLRAGRAPAALAMLSNGLSAAESAVRDKELASLADDWKRASLDLPTFDKIAKGMSDALQKGEPARAEKLGRFAVAYDPGNAEAHRNLGLALAQQGKIPDALHHLVRATREQATQILSGVLHQAGSVPEAMAVLDYASRWYVRADQWLTYGGIAYGAVDNARAAKAYGIAYRLDPAAFDPTQLNAYAGVLDEVGDYVTCEKVAKQLAIAAGDDLMWKTNAWNHLACGLIGQGHFTRAFEFATRAVDENPLPANAEPFAATLARSRTKKLPTPPSPPAEVGSEIAALLALGDHAAAAGRLSDASWRIKRGALCAVRFRFTSENQVAVTARARAAALAILADTIGSVDRDAILCRMTALLIREQAYFARDPIPVLGDRMTRQAFYAEFRARGGVVLGDDEPPPPAFVDRVIVAGAKVSRASDYIALLRDLAALAPREALAQFDLDDAGYLEVSKAWAAAMEADPSIARTISAGLARARA